MGTQGTACVTLNTLSILRKITGGVPSDGQLRMQLVGSAIRLGSAVSCRKQSWWLSPSHSFLHDLSHISLNSRFSNSTIVLGGTGMPLLSTVSRGSIGGTPGAVTLPFAPCPMKLSTCSNGANKILIQRSLQLNKGNGERRNHVKCSQFPWKSLASFICR